ncbi:DNA polymerase IV [Pseudobacillus wudalianchiensis]|uniref:DNA polymerase IV n=1 Tax=Pseudobacillus wudalianchiensis TaxID=1743143 RepID=A0A1B9B9B3_9BACI|nr:DNA polymerase IV [Bacillus wudalianchiensis]OCA92679.1 DNA polymerase IV [Bacillus wudalianchiensis]
MENFYPKNGRVILHVDMNSFYASVEVAHDPSLRGRPLAIAGNPQERKGIIVTCSYEAREFGIKTTMTVWEAKRLCPELIILPPNFERYRQASQEMFRILTQYTPLIEPVSIDEGYLDITNSHSLGKPLDIARAIQEQILAHLSLPCSIGVAPNKFLAKMASDMKKPLGITVLRKREVPAVLWPLPVINMHGVGQKTADKLAALGILTIGDLAKGNDHLLKSRLGIRGMRLKERANGVDHRKVDPEAANDFKSVGQSITLPKDETKQQELLAVLQKLSERVAARLQKKEVLGTSISIMIRYKDWKTITRSKRLAEPTQNTSAILEEAKYLFLKHWNGNGVRLLGITLSDLVEKGQADVQLDLFSYEQTAKKASLMETMKRINEKYGDGIIHQANEKRPVGKEAVPGHTEEDDDVKNE